MILDVKKILVQLKSLNVRFVIIGGQAVILQGAVRLTEDIDFCYARDKENLDNIVKAIFPFHPHLRGAEKDLPFVFDVRTLELGLNFTFSTDVGDIDLLGEVKGVGDYNDVTVSIKEVKDLTILRLSLYPNPTSSVATIEFDLKNNSPVNVTIYDVMGREIKRVIQNENKPAGKQKIEINVSDLSSGKYICTVMTDHDVMSANFVVNK